MVLAIVGVIALVALPSYSEHKLKTLNSQCISDITYIAEQLEKARAATYAYPERLADLGEMPLDPWGNEYQYLNLLNAGDSSSATVLNSNGSKAKGDGPRTRKKQNLNSDYDLFCTGPDGAYAANVSAAVSRDDIIRADDGAYIGPVGEY